MCNRWIEAFGLEKLSSEGTHEETAIVDASLKLNYLRTMETCLPKSHNTNPYCSPQRRNTPSALLADRNTEFPRNEALGIPGVAMLHAPDSQSSTEQVDVIPGLFVLTRKRCGEMVEFPHR